MSNNLGLSPPSVSVNVVSKILRLRVEAISIAGRYNYQSENTWIVKSDIANFFDSLCWGLLLNALEQLDLESVLVRSIEQQLKAGLVLHGRRLYPKQGVLQGAVLSGALANLYLSDFDRACLRRGFDLVRYGDDFAVACASLAEAERTLDLIGTGLGEIYLKLQPDKTQIVAPDREFIFLGYRFANGKVYSPPPISPSAKLPLLPSGVPQPKPIYTHTRPSRPPKACTLKSAPVPSVPARPQHYFTDTMTTLYITDQGSYLKAQQYRFHVFHQGELRCQIPVNRVTHVVLFGCCNLSLGAVRLALSRRIPILYLSCRGRYFGRLETEGQAKVAYLERQVECAADPEFTRSQAETIVRAKLHNSRILLMRLSRRRQSDKAKSAIETIARLIDDLPLAESIEALRGYEGKAATLYFQGLGSLFEATFAFEQRTKRPPTDPINSLLSLGYTLLSQNVHSFVQALGLHAHFGSLHVPRDNHPALVSDLMEEFRAQLVDSLVAYLVNKKIFTPDDFTPPDDRGGVYLHGDALKKFLKHWEEKLQSEVTHLHTGHKVTLRRCLELQVREYASCLMGDTDGYRPMLWGK